MLSQEKIRGFIVENSRVWDNIEIIPAVWVCFVAREIKRGNPIYIWKEKLGFFDEMKPRNNKIPDFFTKYQKIENVCLENWSDFCNEFEKIQCENPQYIAKVIPFLVRSMKESERNRYYVLFDGYFEWKLAPIYSLETRSHIQNATIEWGGVYESFMKSGMWVDEWEREEEVKIFPMGEVDDVCRVGVRRCPELEKYLMEKFPGRVYPVSALPESWNTVPADPAAAAAESAPASVPSLVGPGSAPADCAAAESAPVSQAEKVEVAPAAVPSLVRPGSSPAAADTVPADPGAVPAEFVPAVIQGTFAKIQDSVRDSKRENSLTEQKKTNLTLNESLDVQTEIRDLLKDGFEMMKPKELTDFEKRVMMFKEIEKRQGTEKARAEIWKTFGGSWKDVWAVEFPNDSLDNYHGKNRRKEAERTKNSIKRFYPEYTPNAETDE